MSNKSRFRFSHSPSKSSRAQRALNLGFESLENRRLFTVDLPPLVDITPTLSAVGSNPDAITQVGAAFYFTAATNSNGRELWKSDGTPEGTVLVKDLRVGAYGSNPQNLTNINGTLYFSANDGVNGIELWKSDGTAAGTVMVKNIRSGTDGSEPKSLTNVNGTLYFSAVDGVTDRELWKSDGTSVGTVLVKDIRAGANSSNLAAFSNVNGTLFFQANDGSHGYELWKSDGTSDGTSLVEDIMTGTNGSSIRSQTVFNGKLYFTADDGIHGGELWKSDGTEVGTELVNDTRPGNAGSYSRNLIELSGSLYFTASGGTIAEGLWKTDGTAAGTELVKNLRVGTFAFNFVNFTNVSGTLYFTGNYGPFDNGSLSYGYRGTELWKSDGTADGTVFLKDFHADTYYYNLNNLTNLNGTLFFSANDGTNGYELWKSDGTVAGTSLFRDINGGYRDSRPSSLTNIDGTLYFKAENLSEGIELWRSDGTIGGTNLFKKIASGTGDSDIGRLTNLDSALYFNARRSYWKSDGTFSGTNNALNQIGLPYLASAPQSVNLNGVLYFSANNAVTGYELWKSDGTFAGTMLVKDIGPSMSNGSPSKLTVLNGTLYFIANDGVHGAELWKSDGTEAGTQLVQDIFPGAGSSNIGQLTTLNQTLFFTAKNAVSGNELWKSDGTAAGTVIVKDITPGFRYGSPRDSNPTYLTNVNGTLYFSADTPNKGLELWKSDGTEAGTLLVKDVFVGADSSRPRYLTNLGGTLYFSAADSNGTELWKSNGTPAGTALVSNIRADSASSFPKFLTNVNGTLYFQADDGLHGSELWKSNGTTVSTTLVQDIFAGLGGSAPHELTNVNGTLYFNGNDGILGEEVWMSNGTASGTSLVIDISSGGSNPANFLPINNKLFFTASTDTYGRELYVISGPTAPQDILLANASLAENSPANTIVGAFSTTDSDTNDAFAYSLISGPGDQDNAQFAIVGNQLRALNSFDFETQSSYSVRVRSTDKFGLFFEKSFLISVTDTASLSAIIDTFGSLVIRDMDIVGKDNRFTLAVNNGNILIADANEDFGSAPIGWTLSTNGKTLSRSLVGLSGALVVFASGGADQMTVDFTGGVLPNQIAFHAGFDASPDQMTITGFAPSSVTTTFTDGNTGRLTIPSALSIAYAYIDSVNLDIRPVDMVINVPSSLVPTPVTLSDDGTAGNATLKLSGVPIPTIFRRPTGTLSLLGGNSPVTVTALPDLRSNLVLGNATLPLASVDFAGVVPVALTRNRSLSVNATNSIILSTADSDLTTSGTGSIQLNSASSIQLLAGSSITTENGSITLLANQQAISNTANSVGIDVEDASIQSTLGSIVLRGKGGANAGVANMGVIVAGSTVRSTSNTVSVTGIGGGTGSSTLNHGVRVNSGGIIGGGAAVTVIGNAGTSVTSSNNFGVTVFDVGSQITSSGGPVTVTGVGGSNLVGTGGTNHGVRVSSGGVITSTGTSSLVSVNGIGGASSGTNNAGVLVVNAGSQISSASGAVSVNGTGGGNSSSKQNYGVWVNSGGVISATGTRSLSLVGTGGNTAGAGTENYGVAVSGAGSKVAANGGTLNVEGTGSSNSEALRLTNGASISNTNSNVVLKANSIAIAGAPLGSIAAGTGEVSIVPRTAGTQIVLGGPDLLYATSLTLGLTGTELNQISGAGLKIGGVDSGKLTTIVNITRSRPTNLALASATEIEIAAQVTTAGGTLLLGGGPLATTRPTAVGIDATASSITLGASLSLEINNGTVDTGYTQVRAVGLVNLNSSRLVIGGTAPTVTGKETFTIVSASSIAGTFLGLADGSIVNVHGYLYKIKYNATTVQLVSQARLYDFDHSGAVATASSYQSVLPTDLFSSARGYGWNAAVTSLARTSAAATPQDLYRDKHVSSLQRSFFVSAEVGKVYSVRVLLGDQSSRSVAISVDGGTTFRTVTTAANQYRAELLAGIVATNDRIEIRIKSGNTTAWAVDGIEVMQVANAPATMRAEGEASAGNYSVPHDAFFADSTAWHSNTAKRKRV